MTTTVKAIISVALSVVLGVGGYFGAAYVTAGVTPAEILGIGGGAAPRDNTGYKPVSFSWDKAGSGEGQESERGEFLAGKYVRNDGNAVLYIDYEDSRDYFAFELCVTAAGKDGLQIDGYGEIRGKTAVYDGTITFENTDEGVIEVEEALPGSASSPDGTYYIVRAKYIDTPKVSPKPSPPPSGEDPPGGGGTGSPSPSLSPSPDDGGDTVDPSPGIVSPSPDGGGAGGTNSDPIGAFRAMILTLQREDYSNREIKAIYSQSEYAAALAYYGMSMAELDAMIAEMAEDTAGLWADAFGADSQTTRQFGEDLGNAITDWFKAFEYTVDYASLEYTSPDAARFNITVTRRIEFEMEYFAEVTLMETLYKYGDFYSMSEQEIINWLLGTVMDYLMNPGEYGDVAAPNEAQTVYTVRQPDAGWVVDNYENDPMAYLLLFDGEGILTEFYQSHAPTR